jgi:hypothetical protein
MFPKAQSQSLHCAVLETLKVTVVLMVILVAE